MSSNEATDSGAVGRLEAIELREYCLEPLAKDTRPLPPKGGRATMHQAVPASLPIRYSCFRTSMGRLAVIFGLSTLLFASTASGGPSRERVQNALEGLKESGRYEFSLPKESRPGKPPPAKSRRRAMRPPSRGPGQRSSPPPQALSSELQLLFWVVGLALLGYLLLPSISELIWQRGGQRALTERKARKAKQKQEEALTQNPMPTGDEALLQAEEDARKGDFANAVHRLWLGLLFELGHDGRTRSMSPSDTGRDIVMNLRNQPHLAQALKTLVVRVEVSHFGGRPLTRADYGACVKAFHSAKHLISGGTASSS